MAKTNKHGLSRTIPPDIKRQIRHNSKFGCVICRQAIYTYEHIDPLYVDAISHDPECMCILCPNHQRDSTDGVLSKSEIKDAYQQIKSSTEPEPSNRYGFFDLLGSQIASVQIGETVFTGFSSIINIDGVDYLSIKKNPEFGRILQMNAIFHDNEGNELFKIIDNEWTGNNQQWDIDFVGPKITIRRKLGDISFSAYKNAITNTLVISHLNMWAPPFHIKTDKGQLIVGQHDLHNNSYVYFGIIATIEGGKCGLYLNSSTTHPLAIGTVKFVGGNCSITGTGINIGRGGSNATLDKATIAISKNCPKLVETPPRTRVYLQLFVIGELLIKTIHFPDWIEEEYYLNGLRLQSRPSSWGVIEDKDKKIELFHISGTEEAPLEATKGFIGYWADDILKEKWADKVFECEVWEGEDDNRYPLRVKRSDIGQRVIRNELNPATGKWFHPIQFAGIPVWKE